MLGCCLSETRSGRHRGDRIKAIFHYGRLACAGRAGFENCAHAGLTGSKNNAQPPANYMAFYAFLYILIIHPHLFLDCHK